MHRFRHHVIAISTCIILLLLLTAGCASAQNVPSHTEISPSPTGQFNFPTDLQSFGLLATYSNGIIDNVTKGNFTNARVLLVKYNGTINSLLATNGENSAITAMSASRDDFETFITNAQRFNDLYVNETSLMFETPLSNVSIANTLEMRALNGTLNGLQSTIEGRNADIYGTAVANGLNVSQYGNQTALFKTYSLQVGNQLSNVTALVFQTPTLTLTGSKNNVTYSDVIVLAGRVQSNGTGIANSSVEIHVDNTTFSVPTNATGSYTYKYVINMITPGAHVAFAKFTPVNIPYNPAQSPPFNFTVATLPVTNTLSALSSSIALGSDVQARGMLTTAKGPVVNGTVVLFVGGSDVAHTQTDQNGSYSFSVPSLPIYASALSGGVTAYTIFNPSGQPLETAASAAVHVPADLTVLLGIIVAVVAIVLLIIFLWRSGLLRRVLVTKPAIKPVTEPVTTEEVVAPVPSPAKEARPIVAPVPVTRVAPAPQPLGDWERALDEAREAFARADDAHATKTLFEAAVTSLAAAKNVNIPAYMTHWEMSSAVAAALHDAEAHTALRQLTMTYELANFGDRTLMESQREAALSAFASLRRHVSDAEGPT